MPFKNPEDRKAYRRKYNATPTAKKNRAQANKARRMMMAAGKVKKGDGKDVHHKKPLSKGGKTTRKNIAVVSRSANRGRLRVKK